GEQDGMPYYVMQFIQGLGLDEVLDELKKLQLGHARTGSFIGGELRISRPVGQVAKPAGDAEGRFGNLPHGELSAVHVARSLLTGEFQRANDQSDEDAAAAPEGVAGKQDQAGDGPRSPNLSDSFTL